MHFIPLDPSFSFHPPRQGFFPALDHAGAVPQEQFFHIGERLASLMAKVAPNKTGAEVLELLKAEIEASGPEAVVFFDKCAAREESVDESGQAYKGGRDDQGFVYIRKQKKVA